MSSSQSPLYRCNSLDSLNLDTGIQNKMHTLSRSNSIDRSTFPDLIASNPHKVFPTLKEYWDIQKLEKNIKHRIHIATLAGVINFRKMQLKTSKSSGGCRCNTLSVRKIKCQKFIIQFLQKIKLNN